jgi:glycosyltransferase involved in cell wall biosynthesis
VIHVHVGFGEWMSPLLKWSLKRADALIAVSEFVAGTLVASGHDRSRIHVVLNAIDPEHWHSGTDREAARRELGLPPDAPVVITVCRLFPAKGPAELLQALPRLREQYPELRLVVVGHELVAGYQAELEELAHKLGVRQGVVFTGRRTDVERMLAAADVFAMPSFGEPFGLVFLEAMAMSLPVVALDVGGAPEIIEEGVSGFLTSPGDRDGLVERLLVLIGDPAFRGRLGAAGRRRVESHFTTARMAADTAAVYERLTRRPAGDSNKEGSGHGGVLGGRAARVPSEHR